MRSLLLLPLTLILAACASQPPEQAAVMHAMEAFPNQHPYKWEPGTPNTGVPEAIVHRDTVILDKSADGTFCCGYTLAVGNRAGRSLGLFQDKTVEQMRQFQHDWFGDDAEIGDPLISTAMVNLGVGNQVAVDDARPGDFLQFWRNSRKPSGHSVVFLGWLTEGPDRVGIRYRSSNFATDGIADFAELFDGFGGRVDPEQLYFARFGQTAASHTLSSGVEARLARSTR